MRRYTSIPFVMMLALCWMNFWGSPVEAKTASPRTVLDYFLLLPDKDYFTMDRSSRLAWTRQPGRQAIIDLKNDYIQFPGEAGQPTLDVALFKHRGNVLVAVHASYEMGQSLDFWRYRQGQWTNVTRQTLPVPYSDRYDYRIPRYGTTVKVVVADYDWKLDKEVPNAGKRVYDLIWSGGRFHVKR